MLVFSRKNIVERHRLDSVFFSIGGRHCYGDLTNILNEKTVNKFWISQVKPFFQQSQGDVQVHVNFLCESESCSLYSFIYSGTVFSIKTYITIYFLDKVFNILTIFPD